MLVYITANVCLWEEWGESEVVFTHEICLFQIMLNICRRIHRIESRVKVSDCEN